MSEMSENPKPKEPRLNIRVPADVHKRLKLLAVEKGQDLTDLLNDWINEKLEEEQQPKQRLA